MFHLARQNVVTMRNENWAWYRVKWKMAGNFLQNRCECLFVFTFLVLDLLLKIIKVWESLKQIILYTYVPCTTDIMPKWTWLSLESFTEKKIDSLTPLLSLNIFIDPWCICENLSLLMGEKLTKGLQKEETWKGSNRRKERKWAVTKSKIVESSSHTRNESQHSINSTCKN